MCRILVVVVWSASFWQGFARGVGFTELTRLIDQHTQAGLSDVVIESAAQTDDAGFLRRVTLNLHGVVPSAEAATAFLNIHDSAKRDAVIDELLASPQFAMFFGDQWSRYLIAPLVSEQQEQTERSHAGCWIGFMPTTAGTGSRSNCSLPQARWKTIPL